MENENSPPSFSAGQRWAIFFSVVVSIIAAVALFLMVNYLGTRYYLHFLWSNLAGAQLSSQTMALVKSITNQVNVVIYYDKRDNLYQSVDGLLKDYQLANPKISVQTVDYLVDASKAQKIKDTYKLGSGEDKNVVIFDCEGRRKIVQASLLGDFSIEQIKSGVTNEFERTLKAFEGEKWFSAALLNVISPKPRRAYFVEGNGEHGLTDSGNDGYQKFGLVLEGNNIQTGTIKLLGTNTIPADCNLLVIAGPRRIISAEELDKIQQYLSQGGRMLALFNFETHNFKTGLEQLLAGWNIGVGFNVISDPDNTSHGFLMVDTFNRSHPLTTPLIGSSLALVNPRTIEILPSGKEGPEAPVGIALAFTAKTARVSDVSNAPNENLSLIASVEKGSIKGVVSERGTTAMVIVGDSTFLNNSYIDAADNRDFAAFAVNWLLDQTQLLQGVGPHAVKEYKLMMTDAQLRSVEWLFLGAMPGAFLLLGGLVWFRRRR